MQKFLKFTTFNLLVVLVFASCKKEKEVPVIPVISVRPVTPAPKTVTELIFSNLKWGLDQSANMLTTHLSIPDLYSVDSILVVYAGSESRIIPKYNGTFLPLYYIAVDNDLTIYHSYSGAYPDRNNFTNPIAYAIAQSIFIAESIGFGWVKVVFR